MHTLLDERGHPWYSEMAMKTWVVQYRRAGSGSEWQTATPSKALYWTEEIARRIADQSNKVDREGFEWRAEQIGRNDHE